MKGDLEDILQEYINSIPGKIALFEKLVKDFSKNGSPDVLKTLREEVHKVSGSAGTYGFNTVSMLCKGLVAEIDGFLQNAGGKKSSDFFCRKLQSFQETLKEEFSAKKGIGMEEKPLPVQKKLIDRYKYDLYIANSELSLLEYIQKEGRIRGLAIGIQTDPDEAWRDIEAPGFSARILIAGECYAKKTPKTKETKTFDPNEFVGAFLKKQKEAIVGLLVSHATLQMRQGALRHNITYLLEKNVSAESILNIAESHIPEIANLPFRVMVLDDDPSVCNFIVNALEEIGIAARAAASEEKFYEELQEYAPDLLILDLVLETLNGMELLKTVRSDARFLSMPIIMITALDNIEMIKEAHLSHVDEYIVKPLARGVLQAKVAYFAHLRQRARISQPKEHLTGMLQSRAFLRMLAYKFERIAANERKQSLALVFINDFDRLMEKNGRHAVEHLQVDIGNALLRVFRFYDLIGWLDEKTAAVFLENTDEKKAASLLVHFLHELYPADKYTLSFSVATYPDDAKNSHELMEVARKRLQESGRGTKELAAGPKPARAFPEIFLLDDDPDICNLLRFAFEKQGYHLTTAATAREAMAAFEKRESGELPALLIFDRLLPDGDGLDVYRKLKHEYLNFPPTLFLTKLSAEHDVLAGLKEGALDYITKPFSLHVLMEKAVKLLNSRGT